MRSALLGRTLAAVGGLGVAVATYDALFGGFSLTVLDVRISSREAYKPLAEGVTCIVVVILAGHVAVSSIARVPLVLRGGCMALLCALVAYWYLTKASQLGVFNTAANEHRYVAIGEYLGAALPSNAFVLTQGESGSVRWYGKRPTVRWDL